MNNKIILIIERCVSDASNYINIHGEHYKEIFYLLKKNDCSLSNDKIEAKEMFNNFVKLFITIQMYLRKKEPKKRNPIIKSLHLFKKIFDQISLLENLSKHQKVDIITIKVYLKILLKLFKKLNLGSSEKTTTDNTNIIHGFFETDQTNQTNQTVQPYQTYQSSSTTASTTATSTTCPIPNNDIIVQNDNTNDNINNNTNNKNTSSGDNKNGIKIPGPTCQLDQTSNPVNILKKNKKYLLMAVSGLKTIIQLLAMIETIFSEMKLEYLQKINCYNLYDRSLQVNENDVEFNEKLLTTSYDQLNLLISGKQNLGTGIFNDISDVQPIEVFLENGKAFILCTIDNFRVKLMELNGFNTLAVDIGKKRYYVKYLKSTLDNMSTIAIMKENFNSLKTILYAIQQNKKLILYWLNMLKENLL